MKIFLSSVESGTMQKMPLPHYLVKNGVKFRWNLMSYYYFRNNLDIAHFIHDHSQEILIDSGAHSFQKGKKVNWIEYTKEYASWIENFDTSKVLGYFEMDIDNIVGYDRVLELRKILEDVSDKIIPVWHKNRGIDDYRTMCEKYAGKIVAITGFKNEDIQDHQYLMFLKYAKKYDCKVHCLGMTRKRILDVVPFDYVDSSSWKQNAVYGIVRKRNLYENAGKKVSKDFSKKSKEVVFLHNYVEAQKTQDYYYKKWQQVCQD